MIKDRETRKVLALAVLGATVLPGCAKITPNCIVAPQGVVGWWNGDHPVANLIDSSLGSLLNVTTTTGQYGLGYSFSPYKSSISASVNSNLTFTDSMTAVAWVKMSQGSSLATGRTILSKGARSTNYSSSQFSYRDLTTIYSGAYNLRSGTFDGRYLYLIPYNPGGPFVRYDTQTTESFNSSTSQSWVQFNPNTLKSGLTTYNAGVFDGRYMYFASINTGTIIRYDTQSTEPFSSSTGQSWKFIEISSTTLGGATANGYGAGAFDGRYSYFISSWGAAGGGIIARYDTLSTESFDASTTLSWKFLDVSQSTLGGANAKYFSGLIFDGRYLYLIPTGKFGPLGVYGRYDTRSTEDFSQATSASWSFFDVSTLNAGATGPYGAVFDGRYIHVPHWNPSTSHAIMSRYDTQSTESFSSATAQSWNFFDLTNLISSLGGFTGATFDGRFVYHIPLQIGGTQFGIIPRYDTQSLEDYASATRASWSTLDASTLNANAIGYLGAVSDGRYTYFVPTMTRGTIVRLDSVESQTSFELKASSVTSDGFSSSFMGPSFQIYTNNGLYQASINTTLDTNWHLVAGTYDGTSLKLYLDGVLQSSQLGSGNIISNNNPVTLGSLYQNSNALNGTLNDAQVYNRALSAAEIRSLYSNLLCK